MKHIRQHAESLWAHTTVRYVVVGATAAGIDVGTLFLCTHFAGVYYLISAVIAASVSFVARFALQKIFAFRDRSVRNLPRQFGLFALLYAWSVTSTVGLLYVFVEWVGLWYILAQVLAILIIASISFFVYRYLIFPHQHDVSQQ